MRLAQKLKFLVVGFAGMAFMWAARAEDYPGIRFESLLSTNSSWNGTRYQGYPSGTPKLTVLKITIAANTAMPWHTHPIPNAAYVLSGTLKVEKLGTGESMQLSAGQVLPEMVNEPHRGVTGDAPVELIVFYAGNEDLPLSRPYK